jgi:hypothetical protein
MSEMDVLSLLIGDIYDAALDPTLWTPVLANAAAFVGGISATLFTKDASTKSGGIVYDDGGIDAHYKQLYFERYIKLDPATTGHYFATIDEPMATADLVPYDEFLQSRFYLEWARPQKLVDFVTSTLDKSATSAAFFGVFRHERDGIVDEATRRRMRQIAPHIRRAVLVGRAIDLKTAEAATLTETLDGISAGMFLVDANGRVVHANVAGHAILQNEDYLFMVGGRPGRERIGRRSGPARHLRRRRQWRCRARRARYLRAVDGAWRQASRRARAVADVGSAQQGAGEQRRGRRLVRARGVRWCAFTAGDHR